MENLKDNAHIVNLILKFLKDDLSDSEKEVFENWLALNDENKNLVESFKDTETVQNEIDYIQKIDPEIAWADFLIKINTPLRKPSRLSWMKYAAVVFFTFAIGSFIYFKVTKNSFTKNNSYSKTGKNDILPGSSRAFLNLADGTVIALNDKTNLTTEKLGSTIENKAGVISLKTINQKLSGYNVLQTPKAGEYQLILPDGTKVWLNAASSLKFANNFNANERKVELTGEAYFEVAHNSKKPFIVNFNNTQVLVLGTHFNINSYKKESITTLIEGSIKITENGTEKLLKPGEEAISNTENLETNKINTYKSTAWKEGVFYFKEDHITDILDQIARWYDVKITYKGKPSNKKYSGNIRRQATLNQVLEMLNAVTGYTSELTDNNLTFNFK